MRYITICVLYVGVSCIQWVGFVYQKWEMGVRNVVFRCPRCGGSEFLLGASRVPVVGNVITCVLGAKIVEKDAWRVRFGGILGE